MEQSGYAFEDHREEQRRLERQAELFDPLTEPVFRAAGLGPGMRVLDLGSGAGDVAMLAARMVGSTGGVLGVERDPAAVASATARVEQTGMPNVRFVEDDVQTLAAMEVSSMPSRDGWCSCTCPILPPHWRERWSCCGAGGLVCVQEGGYGRAAQQQDSRHRERRVSLLAQQQGLLPNGTDARALRAGHRRPRGALSLGERAS